MFHQKLFDHRGNPILLSKELGRGGEGSVFNLQNSSEVVAKLYNKIPDAEKAEKIAAMISMGTERLLKLTTWPIHSIHNSDNKLVGFTMPKLTGYKPIFELYSPKIRLQEFPKADWRFLIHAATNTARAFSVIHDAGHVIGDVNHGNLFVASNATVQFIDTDSFQIYSKDRYWFCEVGVPTHQPPEMQNKSSYRGVIRTPNHDNFGLAILIFQLLCLARHPFSGRYLGSGEMPIEKAISEYRYAYAADTNLTKMSPPPASLSMSALTPNLKLNFERAFSKEGEKLGFRPSPKEWITALTELSSKLKQCSTNQSHHFFEGIKNCPWCDIETHCNALFFPVIGSKSSTDINITGLWQQFLSIKSPINIPLLVDIRNFQTAPSTHVLQIGKKLRGYRSSFTFAFLTIVAIFSAVIGPAPIIGLIGPCIFVVFFLFYNQRKEKLTSLVSENLNSIKPVWESLCLQHEALTKNYSFEFLRNQINDLKNKYDDIGREREKNFQDLVKNRFQQQLKQYLDSYRIDKASIEGIGQGRIATLQSYSIETAADIDMAKLMNISGFGHVLVSRLMDWRKMCESRFILDSKKEVSQSDVAALDREIGRKRKTIEAELSIKILQLSQLSKEINASRQNMQDQINEVLPKYAQAIADAKAVGV